MRKLMTRKYIEVCLFIFLAAFSTFFSSPKFTSQWWNRPKDHVFVGLTTYWEDFYYYLDQFHQGREGNWLTENRFAIERLPPTLLYFNHLLFGRIGGAIGLASYESYNLFGMVFKLLFILFSYLLICLFFPRNLLHRIGAYMVFLFSSSIPIIALEGGKLTVELPSALFRTSNRVLSRFSTSPNGMFVNFLFISIMFLMTRWFSTGATRRDWLRRLLFLIPAFTLMALGDNITGLFVITVWTVILAVRKKLLPLHQHAGFKITLVIMGLITGMLLYYTFHVVNHDPMYEQANSWDVYQYLEQLRAVGVDGMIRGFGMQWPLGLLGLFVLLRKRQKTIFDLIALLVVGISFCGYMIPLAYQVEFPGFRFLFPAVYLFLSVLVIVGLQQIAGIFKSVKAFTILLVLLMTINFLSFFRGWYDEIQPLVEPNYHFAYIPADLYRGLLFLRSAEPKDGNVLASPITSIDMMIPGITGKYSYTGHFLMTPNNKEKDELANKMYFEWTDTPETHAFLQKNNIRFIVVTQYSRSVDIFKMYYPFLKVAFENPAVTIFRYDY